MKAEQPLLMAKAADQPLMAMEADQPLPCERVSRYSDGSVLLWLSADEPLCMSADQPL